MRIYKIKNSLLFFVLLASNSNALEQELSRTLCFKTNDVTIEYKIQNLNEPSEHEKASTNADMK